MRLLIVDDNKYVVEGLKRQLNWGVFGIDEIIGCYRVQQAQEILMEKEIDLFHSILQMICCCCRKTNYPLNCIR